MQKNKFHPINLGNAYTAFAFDTVITSGAGNLKIRQLDGTDITITAIEPGRTHKFNGVGIHGTSGGTTVTTVQVA